MKSKPKQFDFPVKKNLEVPVPFVPSTIIDSVSLFVCFEAILFVFHFIPFLFGYLLS